MRYGSSLGSEMRACGTVGLPPASAAEVMEVGVLLLVVVVGGVVREADRDAKGGKAAGVAGRLLLPEAHECARPLQRFPIGAYKRFAVLFRACSCPPMGSRGVELAGLCTVMLARRDVRPKEADDAAAC